MKFFPKVGISGAKSVRIFTAGGETYLIYRP